MNPRLVAILGAPLGTICFSSAAISEELDLPREHGALAAPPFVHPHEQATNQGPKILEFTLGGKADGHRHRRAALAQSARRFFDKIMLKQKSRARWNTGGPGVLTPILTGNHSA